MAVRVFQFSVVFAIGFCFGPAAESAVATGVTEIPLSLYLKDPEDVIVGRGQAATLKCEAVSSSARGSNTVHWSWLYEGNLISVNDTRRQIFDNGSLHIPSVVGRKMEGEYQCLARNDIGTVISNPAKLKIATISREFIEQPNNNISVAEQQPVVLPCRIQSTPNALIHWEHDYKPLPHSTRYVPLPLGALLITSTHSSDTGFYRCVATNKILKKTKRSKSGQLTVLPPGSIEPPKFLPLGIAPNVTILVGNNLTLYCAVTGWPTPTIQWRKNMSIVLGNSSILELRNASEDVSGDYSCSASNSAGYIIMHYVVQVEQPPHFNVTPVSVSYPSARTIRLDCQVKGIPQPEIFWLKNGEVLETVGRIKQQQSGLVLSHSFTTDAGLYQCVAVNSAGRAWVSAQLIPSISKSRPSPPQNVQCRPFDDTSICLMWDAPPINVKIQAYSIYAFSSDPTVEVRTQDFVTNLTHKLASGLDSSTNYTFYVRSYSKEASDQSNNVSCRTGIKEERNLKVERLSETSVKLTWSNISNDIQCGSTAPIIYRVQWKRTDQHSTSIVHTKDMEKVITELRLSATYEFRVESSTNKNDQSPAVRFTLSTDKTNAETTSSTSDYTEIINELNNTLFVPQQVEADPLSPYSINLTWMNVEEDEKVFFTVCYVEAHDDKKCEKGHLIRSDTNYMEVKNLKPNTKYEFKVRSEDLQGSISPFSHSVLVRTPVDVPSPVQDLRYKIINATTVCIRWRAPLHKNGKLTKYVVLYTPDQNWPLEQWYNIDVPATQTMIKKCWPFEDDAITVVLSKLKQDAQYTVLVRAATEAGLSNPTVPLNFAIKDELPVSDDSQDDVYYKQKLGVALGVSISLLCILCCITCIIFRRRCVKREAFARARLRASNNYYPSTTGVQYAGTSLQLRHQESCAAEAHEMQHLVSEEGATHIPPLTPSHLDTKGGAGFPNGQLNGTLKHAHANGHVVNGHVHITENPRYDYHDCNGHTTNSSRKPPKQESLLPSLRNCARRKARNSSADDLKNNHHQHASPVVAAGELQGITPYDISQANLRLADMPVFKHPKHNETPCSNNVVRPHETPNEMFENGKLKHHHDSSEISRKIPDYNSNCNSELNEMYSKLQGGDSLTSEDNDLNVTQMTCLDDSFSVLLASHRKISPALGPNG